MKNKIDWYRLDSMPYAQCKVGLLYETDSTGTTTLRQILLRSYGTIVCRIICKGLDQVFLYCSGTYSKTTARHINRFTTEFWGQNMYHECKHHLHRDAEEIFDGQKFWFIDFKVDDLTVTNRAFWYETRGRKCNSWY